MYRHLMRFTSKSGVRADSKGQMSTLSRADCTEKQDLSDPRHQNSPSWPEVPVILAGSFQHCRRQVCIPYFFSSSLFSLLFPLHLSVTFGGVGRDVSEAHGGRTPVLRAPGPKHVARCLSGCVAHVASLMLQVGRGSKNKRRKCHGKWFAAARGPRPGIASAHSRVPTLDVTGVSKSESQWQLLRVGTDEIVSSWCSAAWESPCCSFGPRSPGGTVS